MSRKQSKKPKAYQLSDLKPKELRDRLTAQDFFNSFQAVEDTNFDVLCFNLRDQDLEDWSVYPEILYRLDLVRLKNLARYIEMSYKKMDQFPAEIRNIYSHQDLKSKLLKRWKNHLKEDPYKFFKVLEEYFLPPKV